MKPKIFLSTPLKAANYQNAFTHCGAECMGENLTPYPDNIAELCDGLVLCGGVDVHPRYYGEEIDGTETIHEDRDIHEMGLLDRFVKAGKPIFGICRGHQIINVYFGGTLVQDLDTRDLHTAEEDLVHEVVSDKDSILAQIYGGALLRERLSSSSGQGTREGAADYAIFPFGSSSRSAAA